VPISPLKSVLAQAFERGYGVAAFNVVNDLTAQAVVDAAIEARAPVIVQTSVKTVRAAGTGVLAALVQAIAANAPVPVVLHLDHCPSREVISECIRHGWNSVLFDGSGLELDDCMRQTKEVVAEAHASGVDVEGEIEGIRGVEDGIGSALDTAVYSVDSSIDFITATGVDCFAPAIGNAHGMYSSTPSLDAEKVTQIASRTGVPVVLHGGTGLTEAQFRDLVRRGCAKVNISTALKQVFIGSSRAFLNENPGVSEPLQLLDYVRQTVRAMALSHIRTLGGEGQA
jgi:fructose-bisphosphate aldolase, class II